MVAHNGGSKAPWVVVPMGLLFVGLGLHRLVIGEEVLWGVFALGIGSVCAIAGVLRFRRTGRLGEP